MSWSHVIHPSLLYDPIRIPSSLEPLSRIKFLVNQFQLPPSAKASTSYLRNYWILRSSRLHPWWKPPLLTLDITELSPTNKRTIFFNGLDYNLLDVKYDFSEGSILNLHGQNCFWIQIFIWKTWYSHLRTQNIRHWTITLLSLFNWTDSTIKQQLRVVTANFFSSQLFRPDLIRIYIFILQPRIEMTFQSIVFDCFFFVFWLQLKRFAISMFWVSILTTHSDI